MSTQRVQRVLSRWKRLSCRPGALDQLRARDPSPCFMGFWVIDYVNKDFFEARLRKYSYRYGWVHEELQLFPKAPSQPNSGPR